MAVLELDECREAISAYRQQERNVVLPPPAPHAESRDSRRVGAAALGRRLDDHIQRVVQWLREVPLSEVTPFRGAGSVTAGGSTSSSTLAAASEAVGAVMSTSARTTFQQTKAYKHRVQVEAIAAHCLRHVPKSCETIVELGAGQAVLGHAVSMASGLPLVAIERRGNVSAFEMEDAPNAPSVQRVQADIGDVEAWPQCGELALLAKHLCSHGSDLAVDAAMELSGGRMGLLCLAPCCHSKMSWREWSEDCRQWFREAGFPGEGDDFALLCDVIKLSRAGQAIQGRSTPCGKWRMRQHLSDTEIDVLGQRAARAIDEARLARLRRAGCDVALVEYCEASLTPDNVLLLAVPSGRRLEVQSRMPTSLGGTCEDSEEQRLLQESQRSGVILELDPTGPPSLQQRFTSYLHEGQARGKFPSLRGVAPMVDSCSSRTPAVLCTPIPAENELAAMQALLMDLTACQVVFRTAVRLLPFSSKALDIAALVEEVKSLARQQDPQALMRVIARPRALEATLVPQLGKEFLAPAKFSHTLCVVEATSDAVEGGPAGGFNEALRFALLPRKELDPTLFGSLQKEDELHSRPYWRCYEVASRWPQRLAEAATQATSGSSPTVAVWSDSDRTSWVLPWMQKFVSQQSRLVKMVVNTSTLPAFSKACAEAPSGSPESVKAMTISYPLSPDTAAVDGIQPASILLCDVNSGSDKEIVDALEKLLQVTTRCEAPLLSPVGGLIICRFRPGRSARAAKKWHKEMAQLLEERLGASAVELLHLLVDKEPERTGIFHWGDKSAR
eukprot:TRINITY_DN45174_c0_g1_i1.p1 TRINITY_DN45174_c0_g1~~TRINITY_DN45174_c0_g1_i1.p1  ORF type:complete len:786 (+),score=116.71 TRINITY_DN45174_c0_g1_i1:77-2434(+)